MPRHRAAEDQVGYNHDIDTLTTRLLALERAIKALDTSKKPVTVSNGPTYTVGSNTNDTSGSDLPLDARNTTSTASNSGTVVPNGYVTNGSYTYDASGSLLRLFDPSNGLSFRGSNSIGLSWVETSDGRLEISYFRNYLQTWPPDTANKTLAIDEWAQFDTTAGALYATVPSAGFYGGGRSVIVSNYAGDNPIYVIRNASFIASFQEITAEPRSVRLLWPGELVEISADFSSTSSSAFKAWVVTKFIPGRNRTVASSADITAKAGGTYEMDATAGNRVVTLDLAQLSAGAFGEITVIKTDAGANTVTIASQAGFTGIGSGTSGSVTPTANTTINSRELSSVSSFTGLFVGQAVSGTNILAGSTIIQLDPANNKVMLSTLCTATGTGITVTANYTEAIAGVAGADVLANQGESITLRPSIVSGSNKWSIVARVV